MAATQVARENSAIRQAWEQRGEVPAELRPQINELCDQLRPILAMLMCGGGGGGGGGAAL